jgi:hypothetical protein
LAQLVDEMDQAVPVSELAQRFATAVANECRRSADQWWNFVGAAGRLYRALEDAKAGGDWNRVMRIVSIISAVSALEETLRAAAQPVRGGRRRSDPPP